MSDRLRIGTRSSAMALAQTEAAAEAARAHHPGLQVDIVRFKPAGDRDQTSKLDRHGGKGGAFVGEIREAMRSGALEAAMHSLKDMPGDEEAPGLVIAAMLTREPSGDALVLKPGLSLEEFEKNGGAGFKIGTNAVRRAAFLRRLFPNAEIIHFRGAADTRIRKLDEGAMQNLPDGGAVGPADALVVAEAGLHRVRLADRIAKVFDEADMPPAIGQGVVALECAAGDWETRRRLAALDHEPTRICAEAEREVLWILNGHCNSPIAGRARITSDQLHISACVISEDGRHIVTVERAGATSRPRELGRDVGQALLDAGAREIIDETRPHPEPKP